MSTSAAGAAFYTIRSEPLLEDGSGKPTCSCHFRQLYQFGQLAPLSFVGEGTAAFSSAKPFPADARCHGELPLRQALTLASDNDHMHDRLSLGRINFIGPKSLILWR